MNMNEELKNLLVYKKPATIIATVLLLLAILPWSDGYYVFLRWVVFIVSGFLVYLAHNLKKPSRVVLFTLIAILFNPFIPIHFDQGTWIIIDFIVAILFLISVFEFAVEKLMNKKNNMLKVFILVIAISIFIVSLIFVSSYAEEQSQKSRKGFLSSFNGFVIS